MAGPISPAGGYATGLDLVDLETFLAVVSARSFSGAAGLMHVSQPSVTARIKKLESTLRTRLLVRTTRHALPTAEGERLAREAEALLAGMRSLAREFRAAADAARNRIAVAVTPTLAAVALPGIIAGYRKRYPDVELELFDQYHVQALTAVESGRADLGIMAPDGLDERFSFELLREETLLLVLPAGHPLGRRRNLTLADVADQPLMVLKQYAALHEALAAGFEKLGRRFRPAMRPGNLNTLLSMVDEGVGLTFLPPTMARHNSAKPRPAVPIADLNVTRRFGIVRRESSEPRPVVESFCRYLREHFPA